VYSDFDAAGNGDARGENFLRGYQWTDAAGRAAFTTIYPGWYTGRTVHIHVKVRVFDGSGAVTTESTTQLLFDDATSDAVYAAGGAYARTGTRDQTNASDAIAASEHPALVVALAGSPTSGYSGAAALAITLGEIHGG
jgi:protocatechuate 3,4-dioxygenase beta subunit